MQTMTINQIDPYPDLIEQGFSSEEAYYLSNQVVNDWLERTRLRNN